MSERPSDIILPPGWTWELVEERRARWGYGENSIPLVNALGPFGGATLWGSIAGYRVHRDRVPAGEAFAVADNRLIRARAIGWDEPGEMLADPEVMLWWLHWCHGNMGATLKGYSPGLLDRKPPP